MSSLLTQKFEKVLNQEILPEVSDSKAEYSMWDDGGCEVETGEYLYGLVRLLKPRLVLETGLYTGISCSYIAEGLKDNGFGKIDTVEYEYAHILKARERIQRLNLQNHVNFVHSSSFEFEPNISPDQYDLMWLDTEPNIRFAELVKFYPMLKPGGFVFIHDLPRNMTQGNINNDHPEIESWPFGNLPQEIKNWLKDGELIKWHFPNPRGMVGFYKKRSDDYVPA